MKQIKYNDIKTPTTVEEFRENLKKYFICTGDDWSNRNTLMVMGSDVKINELNSLEDLYKGWDARPYKPSIAPYVDFDMKSITELETIENMFSRNFESVMKDESRFKIYDIDTNLNHSEFMSKVDCMWYGIDNQIFRQFYIKTLGDFSGYISNEIKEVV